VIVLLMGIEQSETHSRGEGRYDHQGTHGAAPGGVTTRWKKTPGAFFRASLQDGGESQEAMSNRWTIPPRVRVAASIHWIDRSTLTLPGTTPHAPWRPSNCGF